MGYRGEHSRQNSESTAARRCDCNALCLSELFCLLLALDVVDCLLEFHRVLLRLDDVLRLIVLAHPVKDLVLLIPRLHIHSEHNQPIIVCVNQFVRGQFKTLSEAKGNNAMFSS